VIVEVAWDASPTVTITARFDHDVSLSDTPHIARVGADDRDLFDAYVRGWGEKDREAAA
jgi:hypothetical protein